MVLRAASSGFFDHPASGVNLAAQRGQPRGLVRGMFPDAFALCEISHTHLAEIRACLNVYSENCPFYFAGSSNRILKACDELATGTKEPATGNQNAN
jgi:hypothetical protein